MNQALYYVAENVFSEYHNEMTGNKIISVYEIRDGEIYIFCGIRVEARIYDNNYDVISKQLKAIGRNPEIFQVIQLGGHGID